MTLDEAAQKRRNGTDMLDSEKDTDFISVEEALEEIRQGRVLIVVDDEDRENEGDMIFAAEKVTPEVINLLATEARGLICVPMAQSRLRELELGPMVTSNTAMMQTGFTVSVDYIHGTTTGISAEDRYATVKALVDPKTRPQDLARPGHVFPLIARDGGVLRRPGHTEAAVDLARLAGLKPAGVLCEVMTEDGEMARGDDLKRIAKRLGLKMFTINDLITYRLRTETHVRRELETPLPTAHGEFRLHLFQNSITGDHFVALTVGDVTGGEPVLTRIHSQCLTGDVFSSLRCDCGHQMDVSMRRLQEAGRGVLVYLPQEGRGVGLANKLRAYRLQDSGMDTVEANLELGLAADEREYSMGAQVLRDLGVSEVKLLTNNPDKQQGLERCGIRVAERLSLEIAPNDANVRYLAAKRDKLGHLLTLVADQAKAAAAEGRS